MVRGRDRARASQIELVRAARVQAAPGYTVAPRGCGGIGRRARFRSVWGKPRGGSSPLIRIVRTGPCRGRVLAPYQSRPEGTSCQILARGMRRRKETNMDTRQAPEREFYAALGAILL